MASAMRKVLRRVANARGGPGRARARRWPMEGCTGYIWYALQCAYAGARLMVVPALCVSVVRQAFLDY
jgi:hypothetical protein